MSAPDPNPKTKKSKPAGRRERRFRLYYLLMDLSTLFIPVAFLLLFWSPSWDESWTGYYASLAIALVVGFFIYLVPVFLVIAKFMRDDYAEGLWRRTMLVVGVLGAIAPFVLNFGYRLIAAIVTYDSGPLHYADYYLYHFIFAEVTVQDAMFVAHIVFLWSFVLVFQFLRWRDSR